MKVLHAAEIIKGGICTYLRDLIELQSKSQNFESIVAIVPKSQRRELEVPAGVTVVTFDDTPNRFLNSLRLSRKVAESVRKDRPDIVHVHSTFAGTFIRPLLLFKRPRIKVIYCPHGWAFERELSGTVRACIRFLERQLSHFCDAIVCVAQHEVAAGQSAGIQANKLVLIRNGIPRAPGTGAEPGITWPEQRRRLLFVGRFDRQKGVDVLFDALNELDGQAFAYIVGGSVRNNQLAEVPKNARSVGWLSATQLQEYYQSAEIVVIPSRWEGLPLVAAEAMRSGTAVIATRVGGLPELVEDGVTGLLIDSENKDQLVEAVRALSDADIRSMGEAGKRRVEQDFTIERVHSQVLALYQDLLADTRIAA